VLGWRILLLHRVLLPLEVASGWRWLLLLLPSRHLLVIQGLPQAVSGRTQMLWMPRSVRRFLGSFVVSFRALSFSDHARRELRRLVEATRLLRRPLVHDQLLVIILHVLHVHFIWEPSKDAVAV